MDDLLQPADPAGIEPEAPTIDSTMEETFAAIQEREAAEAPEGEKPPIAARARDDSGKFVKTKAEKAAEAVAKPAPGAFEDKGPPNTWRVGAKAQWNNLPPDLKAEVYKREQDAFNGISQYQAKAQIADGLMSTIRPYQPIMDALGADVPTALNEILRTAATLHVGTPEQKAATLRTLAQRHGVDLGQATAHAAADQFADPALDSLRREIAELRSFHSNQQRQAQNSEQSMAAGGISAFQNDPGNKYFTDVAYQMGQLIMAGLVDANAPLNSQLREAYDKACQLNPSVKAAIELESKAATERKSVEERAARAAAARRAGASSVRSTPTPRPTGNTATSWQEGMEKIAAEMFSRDAA